MVLPTLKRSCLGLAGLMSLTFGTSLSIAAQDITAYLVDRGTLYMYQGPTGDPTVGFPKDGSATLRPIGPAAPGTANGWLPMYWQDGVLKDGLPPGVEASPPESGQKSGWKWRFPSWPGQLFRWGIGVAGKVGGTVAGAAGVILFNPVELGHDDMVPFRRPDPDWVGADDGGDWGIAPPNPTPAPTTDMAPAADHLSVCAVCAG